MDEIIILNNIKFEKYDLTVSDNGEIFIIGRNEIDKSNISDNKYSKKKLFNVTYKTGEKIFCLLEDYQKRKKIEIYKNFQSEFSTDKLKLNESIINYINKTFNIEKYFMKAPYYSLIGIYKKIYMIIKSSKINISTLIEPENLNVFFNRQCFGILQGEIHSSINDIKINESLNQILKIAKENIEIIDLKPLLKEINFIPLKIKGLEELISKKSLKDIYIKEKRYLKKLLDIINIFTRTYGFPWYFDKINLEIFIGNMKNHIDFDFSEDSNHKYNSTEQYINILEIEKNTEPINNFIFICISIYLLTNIWKDTLNSQNKKTPSSSNSIIKNIDMLNEIYNLKLTLQNNTEFLSLCAYLDQYIHENCNGLYDAKCKIIRKKEYLSPYNTTTINSYDSVIIAAWDVFYDNVLGKNYPPMFYKKCEICGIEIDPTKSKIHNTTDGKICDECYKKRKHIKNVKNVTNYRKRKSHEKPPL